MAEKLGSGNKPQRQKKSPRSLGERVRETGLGWRSGTEGRDAGMLPAGRAPKLICIVVKDT